MLTLVTVPLKKCFRRATSLILCIEIEQSDRNLIRGKPLGQGDHDASFANAAFAAHGEDNTL